MLRTELISLRNNSHDPCVSIVVPTHRHQPESQKDPIMVKNAVKEAKKQLLEKYGNGVTREIEEKIEELQSQINYVNTLDGLAIFASPDVARLIYLPFEVEEKVVVDNSFEIRDLVYASNRLLNYYLLSLTEKSTRLLHGMGRTLKEVKTEDFPRTYIMDKQMPEPKSPWGVDLSELEAKYKQDYVREIDTALEKYLRNNEAPLFVMGSEKLIGYFKNVTHHEKRLAGKVAGNHEERSILEILDLVWPKVEEYMQNERKLIEEEFEKARNSNTFVLGLEDVWKAAREGNCRHLVVEKDYRPSAWVDKDGYTISESENGLNEPKKVEDAVDDIIEEVMNKDGRITFLDNGELNSFGRMGLILRYPRIEN